jgi:2-hydroxycyclohexanecarboxyl-CoA dehydrogenase
MRFEDRNVVVTGGAKGIGKACCLRFAEEGAKVAVMDIARRRRSAWPASANV